MIARLAGIVLTLASPALADDHVLQGTCWEEKLPDGGVSRHCAVNGVDPGEHRTREAPGPVAPVPVPAPQVGEASGMPPPPAALQPPPPGYYPPPMPPPYYRPPGRLGIAGPLAVFRFGPVTVVIP